MADKPLRDLLNVDSELHLMNDGWEFWTYDTSPESGFLIRGEKQQGNRLEILYWKQDREQNEAQFVMDAETGNIGIGAASPSDKLTIRGGGLSFQQAGQTVSEMGIDYDAPSQSLRIRARKGTATSLSDDLLTITKDGEVAANVVRANSLRANGTNGSLTIASAGTGVLLLNPAGGNVAIGHSQPRAMLDISTPELTDGSLLRFSPKYGDGEHYYLNVRAEGERGIVRYAFGMMNNDASFPNNLVLQSGNVGIGLIPWHASLEVDGTVKATAFDGSGAGITGIKASNITSETLAADRVPNLANLNGKLPVAKVDGIISQWKTSGSTINYSDGKVSIGSLPQGNGNIEVARRSANEAVQAVQALNHAVQTWYARLKASDFQGEIAYIGSVEPIWAAAEAAKAAAEAANQGATAFQVIQAVSKAGRQTGKAAAQVEALTAKVKDVFYDHYWKVVTDFQIEQGQKAVLLLDSLDIGMHNAFGGLIAGARQKSNQALEQSFALFVATALNPESTKLTVNGDSGLIGNLVCWGDIVGNGSIQGTNSDLAENYLSDMDLASADVVCLDQRADRIVRSANPNDTLVIGVISSAPGFLLNAPGESNKASGTLAYPVALCGRVPCKVTDENGPIQRGDLLTTSSTPGHAMKAAPLNLGGFEIHRPGTIIGKALEPFPSGMGVIEVFIGLR